MTPARFSLLALLLLPPVSHALESKPLKIIHFEDELVEGINRRPLDSLNEIRDPASGSRIHLYRRRAGFADRTALLLDEMRITP
ncbi:MAG: hypothetical protein EBX52_05225 [Proteobacteria bacterium]|nr:hypothetical protein [Pseudomonadota bacterium]